MHKRTNGELTLTEKPGISRTKTGCRDCLSVGIIPLKAGWLVGMRVGHLFQILVLQFFCVKVVDAVNMVCVL